MCLLFVLTILVICGVCICDQWEYFPLTGASDYVKFGMPRLNFSDAEELCNSMESHLASIHSEEENTFIYDLASKVITGIHNEAIDILIFGLTRLDSSKAWFYTDGTEVDYTKYAETEPNNNYGNEDCTSMVGPTEKNFSEWHDLPCTWSFNSHVCKNTVVRTSHSVTLPIIGVVILVLIVIALPFSHCVVRYISVIVQLTRENYYQFSFLTNNQLSSKEYNENIYEEIPDVPEYNGYSVYSTTTDSTQIVQKCINETYCNRSNKES